MYLFHEHFCPDPTFFPTDEQERSDHVMEEKKNKVDLAKSYFSKSRRKKKRVEESEESRKCIKN